MLLERHLYSSSVAIETPVVQGWTALLPYFNPGKKREELLGTPPQDQKHIYGYLSASFMLFSAGKRRVTNRLRGIFHPSWSLSTELFIHEQTCAGT
jgi:hypothetical protein